MGQSKSMLIFCDHIMPRVLDKRHLTMEKKRVDSLVWNKTEELLKPAEADVLEIFEWQVRTLHLKVDHANTRFKLLCRNSGADQGRQQVN